MELRGTRGQEHKAIDENLTEKDKPSLNYSVCVLSCGFGRCFYF